MISLTDIVRLLEQLPIWKQLVAIPKRMDALEARIAALETKAITPPVPLKDPCPLCGVGMKVTAVRPDPAFGRAGVKRHDMECPGCGHKEDKQVRPTS